MYVVDTDIGRKKIKITKIIQYTVIANNKNV